MWLAQYETLSFFGVPSPKVILELAKTQKSAEKLCYEHMQGRGSLSNMFDFTRDPNDVYDYPVVTDYLSCKMLDSKSRYIHGKYHICYINLTE